MLFLLGRGMMKVRAQAIAAGNHESSIHSRGMPSLVLNAGASRNYFLDDCCAHGQIRLKSLPAHWMSLGKSRENSAAKAPTAAANTGGRYARSRTVSGLAR